jgi:hypothetical protein
MNITAEFLERLVADQAVGMGVASWARVKPDAMAVTDRFTTRTWGELNANANRLARLFRERGLEPVTALRSSPPIASSSWRH